MDCSKGVFRPHFENQCARGYLGTVLYIGLWIKEFNWNPKFFSVVS